MHQIWKERISYVSLFHSPYGNQRRVISSPKTVLYGSVVQFLLWIIAVLTRTIHKNTEFVAFIISYLATIS